MCFQNLSHLLSIDKKLAYHPFSGAGIVLQGERPIAAHDVKVARM